MITIFEVHFYRQIKKRGSTTVDSYRFESRAQEKLEEFSSDPEPEFANILRNPGIDSKESIPPGWESIPGLLTNSGSDSKHTVL